MRDLEQPSTATVVAPADVSLSTRCGVAGVPIAAPGLLFLRDRVELWVQLVGSALVVLGMSPVLR